MTRLRGRALRGQRVVEAVPHGHWKTTTLIAALDQSGIRCSMVLDGAVDGPAFEAFVGAVLVPTLRPGDLVVLDNLSSHKGPRIGPLIRARRPTCCISRLIRRTSTRSRTRSARSSRGSAVWGCGS